MKKFLFAIVGIILLVILIQFGIYYSNNNLKYISEENKIKLMNILEINESDSFNPIYKKYNSGFHGSDPDYYEIKFEISIDDYEKNDLVYYEDSTYEVLVDCHYKEKKDDTNYTCIVRVSNVHNKELFDIISNYKKYEISDISKESTNSYQYKHFMISFDNGFDRSKNMEYKDKIYHLVLDNYQEYLDFKNNNNDVLEMIEEDFKNNFMIITDIENVSMLGLTLQSFYNNDDELIIELNSYPEGAEYNEKESAISIMIPREMKRDIILKYDMRDDSENSYGWKNTSNKGLTPITEKQAIETAISFARILETSNSLTGKYLRNFNKVFEVNLTKCKPNNYWLITEGILERNLRMADFERDVYEVILVSEDDELEVMRAFFYVDLYTNEVIAGREMAD